MRPTHAGALMPHLRDDSILLLMHFDGAVGASSFLDSSVYRRALTTTGTPRISDDVSLDGSTVGKFLGGAGNYITTANDPLFDFVTEDFTIEMFLWVSPSNGVAMIFGNTDLFSPTALGYYLNISNAQPNFYVYKSDGNLLSMLGLAMSYSAWHHLAVVREGPALRMYVDGGFVASGDLEATTIEPSGEVIKVGGNPTGVFTGFTGYIDELRVTRGLARYQGITPGVNGSFTVPATPFPNP